MFSLHKIIIILLCIYFFCMPSCTIVAQMHKVVTSQPDVWWYLNHFSYKIFDAFIKKKWHYVCYGICEIKYEWKGLNNKKNSTCKKCAICNDFRVCILITFLTLAIILWEFPKRQLWHLFQNRHKVCEFLSIMTNCYKL